MASSPVGEIDGITQGAIVALTRIGVSTVEDLLKADFHEVAYALDSYDDAETLVRSAMKRARSDSGETPRPPEKPAIDPTAILGDLVGPALSAVWDHICQGRTCAEAFDELIRRIEQARLLAELDDDGAATAAALVCDEAGRPIDGTPDEIAELIKAAERLLVVSMTPGGAGRQAHAAMVAESNHTVQLLVAARALSSVKGIAARLDADGPDAWSGVDAGREGTIWYYRTIHESLAAATDGPLIDQLGGAVASLEAAPAAKTTKAAKAA